VIPRHDHDSATGCLAESDEEAVIGSQRFGGRLPVVEDVARDDEDVDLPLLDHVPN
jgi:hypothetical protein